MFLTFVWKEILYWGGNVIRIGFSDSLFAASLAAECR